MAYAQYWLGIVRDGLSDSRTVFPTITALFLFGLMFALGVSALIGAVVK